MRITRSTLRRLIAEESARLLREAAEEESTATNEAERGKKRKKQDDADCLYVLYGGRGVYYYTAPCGLSEEEAAEKGHDVSADVADGEDMADPLSLYDWLQRHDEITAVYDDESAGGEVSKDDFMEQLRGVGEEEGLFASDDDVNEGDDLDALDEMEDPEYNEYLQQQHGRFTSPENVKGTPEYAAKHRQPSAPKQSSYVSRRSEWGDEDLFGGPPRVDEGGPGDDFLDYDPEEIPDMDDQYDPDYYEGLDDEGDDEDFMDYETGDDDVPYGAADVALRNGRGHRTDENDDLYEGDSQGDDDMGYEDDADYEHAYSMGGGSDEEGFAIDYDTGRPSPFAAKMFGQPAAGADDIEGADADEDVWGDDDMGRRGARDDYRHAYKLGGGRDEEGFAADYDTGKKRQFPPARSGLSEARWAKLAGILKG